MTYRQLYEDVKKLVEKEDYRKGIAYLSWDAFVVYYNTAKYRILRDLANISTYLYFEEIYADYSGETSKIGYTLPKDGIILEVYWHPAPYDLPPYELDYLHTPLKSEIVGMPKYYNIHPAIPPVVKVYPLPTNSPGKIYIIWMPLLPDITLNDFTSTSIPGFLKRFYDFVKFSLANYILEMEKKYNEVLKLALEEEKRRLQEMPKAPRMHRVVNRINFRYF